MDTVLIYSNPYAYGVKFNRQILLEAKGSLLASILEDEPEIETIKLDHLLITPRALHCAKAFLEKKQKPLTTDPALEKAGHYLGIPLMKDWEASPTVVRLQLPHYGYSRLIDTAICPEFARDVVERKIIWTMSEITPTIIDVIIAWGENGRVFQGPHEPELAAAAGWFRKDGCFLFMATPF